MAVTHTADPWVMKVEGNRIRIIGGLEEGPLFSNHNGIGLHGPRRRMLADCFGVDAESIANARMMKAAPELLKACQAEGGPDAMRQTAAMLSRDYPKTSEWLERFATAIDDALYLARPCEECDGTGIRAPANGNPGLEGFVYVERCDSCELYESDDAAANAWGTDVQDHPITGYTIARPKEQAKSGEVAGER